MATYEYQCPNPECGAVNERIQPMADPLPDLIPCKFCATDSPFKFSLPSLGRSGMTPSKTPTDVSVGRDAEARWAAIDKRQQARDKVRAKNRTRSLEAHGYRDFAPQSPETVRLRNRALNAVETHGFSPDTAAEIPRR